MTSRGSFRTIRSTVLSCMCDSDFSYQRNALRSVGALVNPNFGPGHVCKIEGCCYLINFAKVCVLIILLTERLKQQTKKTWFGEHIPIMGFI